MDNPDNPDNGRSKALLIGIQYKGQRHRDRRLDLKGPPEDVKAMRDYLINTWNYPSKNIFELLDEPEYVQPTRTNILKYLDLLVQAPAPKTRLFLYYSGHGYQVANDSKTELDGKDETLVPLDWQSGLIRDNILYDHVVGRLPRGCRFTAVFDCCHSGTLLDLPCTRERPPLMHPDEFPISSITTMYYTAPRAVLPISVSAHPGRHGHCATELSGKKLPQRAMTHPPHAQERSDSRNRPFRESVKPPTKAALEPKVHWMKKWFEVFRKPVYAPDINAEYSIACLAPLTSQLAATHADEVGYPLRRESIGHEDRVYISPISESFAESGSQLPWESMTRASEEPPSKALDAQPKRYTESQASPNSPGIRDPLLLPTVFSIGACSDSEEVTEGMDTSAGLLRIALIHCLAEAKDRTWEQLLEDLWHFANTSPEFDSQKKVLPVIGSIKRELTEIVEF